MPIRLLLAASVTDDLREVPGETAEKGKWFPGAVAKRLDARLVPASKISRSAG
jgi:hypothetical protein